MKQCLSVECLKYNLIIYGVYNEGVYVTDK